VRGVLPLGNYTTDREIWLRTPTGQVRRPGLPNNHYRLFAACAECDGPADVTAYLPPGLPPHRPFQAFVRWEDTLGVMVAFRGPPCGTGRITGEQFLAVERGLLWPWDEAWRRLLARGPDDEFWRTHATHEGPSEHPVRRLMRR